LFQATFLVGLTLFDLILMAGMPVLGVIMTAMKGLIAGAYRNTTRANPQLIKIYRQHSK